MDTSKSILSAQYNNEAVTPRFLAHVRGTGQFSTRGTSIDPIDNAFSTTSSSNNWDLGPRGSEYELSSTAPVGERTNDQWKFTADQTNNPPNAAPTGDPYLQFGLRASRESPTALNSLFFNKTNVQYLHGRIIDEIKGITGITIKPQDDNSLLIIMQNKYDYGEAGWLPAQSTSLALPRGPKPCSLRNRLVRLNQAVLQDAVQQIVVRMQLYVDYFKHASSLPQPLSLPVLTTMKGSRVLQENIGLSSGDSRSIDSYNMRDNIL